LRFQGGSVRVCGDVSAYPNIEMEAFLSSALAQLLRAVADPTRLRILHLLLQGSICVCELQQVLRMAQPAISRHLTVLRAARLVTDTRARNRIFYSLAESAAPQFLAFLHFLRESSRSETVMQADLCSLQSLRSSGGASPSKVITSAADPPRPEGVHVHET
jgi:ArsR family transcriptional regulator